MPHCLARPTMASELRRMCPLEFSTSSTSAGRGLGGLRPKPSPSPGTLTTRAHFIAPTQGRTSRTPSCALDRVGLRREHGSGSSSGSYRDMEPATWEQTAGSEPRPSARSSSSSAPRGSSGIAASFRAQPGDACAGRSSTYPQCSRPSGPYPT